MSIGAWRVAVQLRTVGGLTKLVLLLLADRASPEGVAFGRVGGLAEAAGISEREVQRCLRRLEVAGLLGTEDRPGRTSIWRLCLPLEVPGRAPVPVQRHLPLVAAVGGRAVDKPVGGSVGKAGRGDYWSGGGDGPSPHKTLSLIPSSSLMGEGAQGDLGISAPGTVSFARWWSVWPWPARSRRWAAEQAWPDAVVRSGGSLVLLASLEAQAPALRVMGNPPEAVVWLMGRWWLRDPGNVAREALG